MRRRDKVLMSRMTAAALLIPDQGAASTARRFRRPMYQ